MALTQNRMLALIACARTLTNTLREHKRYYLELYDDVLADRLDPQEALDRYVNELHNTIIDPRHFETLAGEEMHFKHMGHRNMRAAAKARERRGMTYEESFEPLPQGGARQGGARQDHLTSPIPASATQPTKRPGSYRGGVPKPIIPTSHTPKGNVPIDDLAGVDLFAEAPAIAPTVALNPDMTRAEARATGLYTESELVEMFD